ncbi:MAG: hypothetical protein PHT16_02745 [Candidatus Pacebacteria bacterium]|nr:hypothetical protein [Candidatus Paceibacterota bacterium]
MQSETKICQNCKKDFTIESEDFKFYQKIKVPPPTFCPDCRLQRRFVFRNERTLYKRTCDGSGKNIISVYSLDKPFKVYERDYYWSDNWDALFYGRQYDFSKNFFIQFKELQEKVPRINLNANFVHNSDYCNYVGDVKNSYLCFGSIAIEDCMYGSPYESKNCVDTHLARECQFCYQCIDCEKLSNSIFAQECSNSFDLIYCFDCKNCQDCIGCTGLRSQKYHIFNKAYSKEQYLEKKNELLKNGREGLRNIQKEFLKIKGNVPHKFAIEIQCKNVTGNNIVQSKNVHNCFDVKKCEDEKYCMRMIDGRNVYDTNYCEFMELTYEYISFWKNTNTKFSNTCGESDELSYCDFCYVCSNCFACVGLRNKSYCILNKQYTKEQYEELVPKIIEHMNTMPYIDSKGRIYKYGEFFPTELSPFCYNETIAQEYFPLTKEEALKQGYKWKDTEERNYKIEINNKDLPDNFADTKEEIIGKVIECEHKGKCNDQCTEAFKVIAEEFSFYKRMNLPIPKLCPNCRHYQRIAQRNPFKLWHRQCMCDKEDHIHTGKCEVEFETSYAPDRPEIVYCEKCYQQEVY